MDADWSVACGADDPTIAVPWSNADDSLAYVNLRAAPEQIEKISEAQQHLALAEALLAWNQPAGNFFTAKCDVWKYPAALFDAEDDSRFAFAQACYVDCLLVAEDEFSNFAAMEAMAKRWCALARTLPSQNCRCEWVVRRAWIRTEPEMPSAGAAAAEWRSGFAATLYVWGYGATGEQADSAWAQALKRLIEIVCAASANAYNKFVPSPPRASSSTG